MQDLHLFHFVTTVKPQINSIVYSSKPRMIIDAEETAFRSIGCDVNFAITSVIKIPPLT